MNGKQAIELLDEVVDICSSGQGGFLEEWHERELKEAFKKQKLTAKDKEDWFVGSFIPYTQDSEGWMVEDIHLIKNLLGIKKKIKISI